MNVTVQLNKDICTFREEITLLDGSKAVLKPICPEDKERLRIFHKLLSEESRFLRYQYSKGELTESDLKNFCDLDFYNNLALVAEKERNGEIEIAGGGRYCRLSDFQTAEVAFVVQDSEQRKGIGTQLLKHLAVFAWERGIRFFVAELLRTNTNMLSIFRKSDPKLGYTDEYSTSTVLLSVEEVMRRGP